MEDCFQQRVLFAFTEEKMIACSLTVALFLLSSTSAAGEVNMKRMENTVIGMYVMYKEMDSSKP